MTGGASGLEAEAARVLAQDAKVAMLGINLHGARTPACAKHAGT
jgi:hypothetical protein